MERQKANLETERTELKNKLGEIEKSIAEKSGENKVSDSINIADLTKSIEDIEKKMQLLRDFLAKIDFKKVQESWQSRKALNIESQALDKEILALEN
ncbi:hypothetical protein J5751_04560 [bacterium]|nr:hypothetical protein [bacterium]